MTIRSSQEVWRPLPHPYRNLAAHAPCAVLLETARKSSADDTSLLFLNPIAELTAWESPELDSLLRAVDEHLAAGRFVAGYFQYECGETFVGLSPSGRGRSDTPLAWLGVYTSVETFHHIGPLTADEPFVQPVSKPAIVCSGLSISPGDYYERIERIQSYLAAGHSYQVNFTDVIDGRVLSSALEVYEALLAAQPVSFAAYIRNRWTTCLSFSPELFYRTRQGTVTVKPMKGTWPLAANSQEEQEAERAFVQDEKIRSEHVTIVDLLRNDVGRISKAGSVRVEQLFSVEKYETLLQMTSTISGKLQELSPSEVFRSLFPSGSITGAPKRRTMEIIRELERQPRGVYSGAIGFFGPEGEATFNVAIRTMTLEGPKFIMGVGGGITVDSTAKAEYQECLLKSSFLTQGCKQLTLFETMLCTGSSLPLLDLHLERLERSATFFGMFYDQNALRAELKSFASDQPVIPTRVRAELDAAGLWTLSADPLMDTPWAGRVLVSADRTSSHALSLRHKCNNREFYDCGLLDARAKGYDEVLFLNEAGHLTEGAISNIFLLVQGSWITPALQCGVLPGVRRGIEVNSLAALEGLVDLNLLQHATEIFLCNALRGLREVYQVSDHKGLPIWSKPLQMTAQHRSDPTSGFYPSGTR